MRLASLALLGGASALDFRIADLSGLEQVPLTESRPLVSSDALQATISGKNLLARAEHLYKIAELSLDEYNHPTRVIGSEGHLGTLSYIYSTIASLSDYYSVSNQTFPAVTGRVTESRLVLGHEVPGSASPMGLTPPTKDKEPVHGKLALVANDGCDASDYPSTLKGNVAFIRRGTCPFGTKSDLAGKAKAVSAVVYNNEPGPLHGTLGTPSDDHVATFGISAEDASEFIKELQKGETVDVIAYMDADVQVTHTNNVVAQTLEGDADNCVMLGGHSDSVDAGPGINDDGSGSITLLEVATQLTRFKVENCVRFAWWSAEEEGLLGSDHYASTLDPEENMKIRLFMDYDMLASPNFAYQVYNASNDENPTGSRELRDLYIDWYDAHGLNYTLIPFDGRSDYDGFIRAGIPAGGIATGAEGIKTKEEEHMFGGKAGDWFDPCYHQLCDDVSNLNMTAWELNSKLVAHSVATFAVSFESFPKRTSVMSSKAYEQNAKYHGPKLIV